MLFRQLFDPSTSTYTYLLSDLVSAEAILIDPVLEQVERDSNLLKELGLSLLYTLDTHAHADHITGAAALRQKLGSKVAISKASGATHVDIPLQHGEIITFGKYSIEARATPGHTDGCMSYYFNDNGSANDSACHKTSIFTGDTLLIRGCGRTDFQAGDAAVLYRSVHTQIFTLPNQTLVYPGHDYKGHCMSTVGEEKQYNPRLEINQSENDFITTMANLNLAHPKRIDVAVPANMRCGSTPIIENTL